MGSVLHRITKEIRGSVNMPDFPPNEYIHNPDMSAVVDQPSKYWDINGDIVTLKDAASRTAADAAEAATLAANALAAKTVAETVAVKAVSDGSKSPSPVVAATLEERVRALELKVYGV
jgi:hypothetical protein